jgi:hypothetical protein
MEAQAQRGSTCKAVLLFCLGSVKTKDAGCAEEIKSRTYMAKVTLTKKKILLLISKLDLNLRKKLVNFYFWNIALCGAETGYLEV